MKNTQVIVIWMIDLNMNFEIQINFYFTKYFFEVLSAIFERNNSKVNKKLTV